MDARLLIGSRAHQLLNTTSQQSTPKSETNSKGLSFESLFRQTLDQESSNEPFRVSSHAQKRLTERSIKLTGELKDSLDEAFNELSAKGAKNSLVLTNEGAFVVNVPNRTLVTAIGLEEMRSGIVTNIDSVNMKFV